jgi:hypothetical protein
MKFIDDIMKEEDGTWSLKRLLATALAVVILFHAAKMILNGPIEEGHELLFGEMCSLLFALMGLTLGNKHKAFKKSTSDESG